MTYTPPRATAISDNALCSGACSPQEEGKPAPELLAVIRRESTGREIVVARKSTALSAEPAVPLRHE